jgi:hypothetical protein
MDLDSTKRGEIVIDGNIKLLPNHVQVSHRVPTPYNGCVFTVSAQMLTPRCDFVNGSWSRWRRGSTGCRAGWSTTASTTRYPWRTYVSSDPVALT